MTSGCSVTLGDLVTKGLPEAWDPVYAGIGLMVWKFFSSEFLHLVVKSHRCHSVTFNPLLTNREQASGLDLQLQHSDLFICLNCTLFANNLLHMTLV